LEWKVREIEFQAWASRGAWLSWLREHQGEANGRGELEFRIVHADAAVLARRADQLLAEAQISKGDRNLPLEALGTMPPDIALPRFQAYLGDPRSPAELQFAEARGVQWINMLMALARRGR
jgi:hypothetical protein